MKENEDFFGVERRIYFLKKILSKFLLKTQIYLKNLRRKASPHHKALSVA
jgi:hypothetical protein